MLRRYVRAGRCQRPALCHVQEAKVRWVLVLTAGIPTFNFDEKKALADRPLRMARIASTA
jgi:hypothetical protein